VGSGIVESSSHGSESSSAAGGRTRLVQRLLDASASLPQFISHLLTTQAVMVAGTEAAGFLIEKDPEGKPVLRLICHVRPDESDADTRAAAVQAFQNLVQPCVAQGKDGAIEVGSPDGGEPQYCLVTLLRSEGEVVAAAAVVTRCRDVERARQRLGSMQLVAGYFDLFTLRRMSEQTHLVAQRHQHVLQYASAIATAEGFASSAMNFCNELATRAGATRVALGWLKGRRVRVKALSHTEKFDKKQELVVQLERVMEECYDQDEPVRFDPAGASTPNVTRAARQHSQTQGNIVVLSLPLRRREQTVGVLTLEFPPAQKPDDHAEAALAVASQLLAPQLYDRYQNDRLIIVKVGQSIQNVAKLAIGPRHMLAKLIILLVLGAAAFVWFYKPMYHVNASFQLQASDKRTLCAPFDGKLIEVHVRPGAIVRQDQVLAEFDTTDKREELDRWEAQARARRIAADNFRSDPTRQSEARQAEEEYRSAMAQVNLLKYQIEQASIRSPFDGIVWQGDLVDMKNSPKRQGDELFQVVRSEPADPRRIALEAELAVAERDIEEVRRVFQAQVHRRNNGDGDDGRLATSSNPAVDYGLRLKRLVPASEAKEGANVYRLYADVVHGAEPHRAGLAPGLAGEARLKIERRRLLWIWTHRLVEYLQLKLWM